MWRAPFNGFRAWDVILVDSEVLRSFALSHGLTALSFVVCPYGLLFHGHHCVPGCGDQGETKFFLYVMPCHAFFDDQCKGSSVSPSLQSENKQLYLGGLDSPNSHVMTFGRNTDDGLSILRAP